MKRLLLLSVVLVTVGFIVWWLITGSDNARMVVVYVSTDQVFSEPVLRDFEKETGIKVRAVYDTEETKSTGAMNRLIAEKDNPQADVYWANEPIRAVILKQKGISTPYLSPNAEGIPSLFRDSEGYWTGFSARARVLVVSSKDVPGSVMDYTNAKWRNQTVIANPLFGTTTSWVAALFTVWGDEKGKEFMRKMKENAVKISTSNGESTTLVVNKEFTFSLVDSDDSTNAIRAGKPVRQIYPDQEDGGLGCLILPNAAVLIKGGPNPENGKKLIDHLLSPETEHRLAFADAAQIPLHEGVETPPDVRKIGEIKAMKIDYGAVAKKLQEIQPFLKEWVGY
ncbi:MAG: extracellular solute-binding protein [Deltaproteobacteria bacterium]|nr:extracellular solute-binding protein [Deltaproteobacteria bacterium]